MIQALIEKEAVLILLKVSVTSVAIMVIMLDFVLKEKETAEKVEVALVTGEEAIEKEEALITLETREEGTPVMPQTHAVDPALIHTEKEGIEEAIQVAVEAEEIAEVDLEAIVERIPLTQEKVVLLLKMITRRIKKVMKNIIDLIQKRKIKRNNADLML